MDVDAKRAYLQGLGLADNQLGLVGFMLGGRAHFAISTHASSAVRWGFYGGGNVTTLFPQPVVDRPGAVAHLSRADWRSRNVLPGEDVERLRVEFRRRASSRRRGRPAPAPFRSSTAKAGRRINAGSGRRRGGAAPRLVYGHLGARTELTASAALSPRSTAEPVDPNVVTAGGALTQGGRPRRALTRGSSDSTRRERAVGARRARSSLPALTDRARRRLPVEPATSAPAVTGADRRRARRDPHRSGIDIARRRAQSIVRGKPRERPLIRCITSLDALAQSRPRWRSLRALPPDRT